jgi:hypothetical protein
MDAGHAVVWREGEGSTYLGALEVAADGLHLRGAHGGDHARCHVGGDEIQRVHVDRTSDRRVNLLPTLVLECRNRDALRIAAVNGAGVLFEIADLTAELASRSASTTRVVIAVPIRVERQAQVRKLVRAGPPFDPASVPGLDHHQVFVTHCEAIFVFEGREIRQTIERLAHRPNLWKAAVAWKQCLAGRPQLIEPAYDWRRSRAG